MFPIQFRHKLLSITNLYINCVNVKCFTRWKSLSSNRLAKNLIKAEKWTKFQCCSTVASSITKNSEWPLYNLQIKTCSDLYMSWFNMKVCADKPLTGLLMNIVYLDTWPTAPKHTPVILALHGIAYSHRFVLPLIPYLLKNRVRIIAPNFPGCGYTPMDSGEHFSHSDQEKAVFIKEFMDALGLSKVDILISHSAAVYPTVRLLGISGGFAIKSLVLLMPGGMEPISKYWFQMNTYLFVSEFLRKIGLRILVKKLMYVIRLVKPNLKMDFDQVDSSIKSLVYNNFDYGKFALHNACASKLPILLMYSKDDHHIGPQIQSLIDGIHLNLQSISNYDDQLKVFNPPLSPGRKSYAIVFKSGGHEIETAHSQVIGEAISDLFQLIVKS